MTAMASNKEERLLDWKTPQHCGINCLSLHILYCIQTINLVHSFKINRRKNEKIISQEIQWTYTGSGIFYSGLLYRCSFFWKRLYFRYPPFKYWPNKPQKGSALYFLWKVTKWIKDQKKRIKRHLFQLITIALFLCLFHQELPRQLPPVSK